MNNVRGIGDVVESRMPDGMVDVKDGDTKHTTVIHDSFSEAVQTLYGDSIRAADGRPFAQLADGAEVTHNGMMFSVCEIDGVGRIVLFAPKNLRDFRGILIQCNGYMQAATSMLTDKILEPLKPIMETHGLVGVAYVHGGRGGAKPIINQGRWGIGRLQREVVQHMKQLLPLLQKNFAQESGQSNTPPPIVLMGHSQGAQTVAHMLRDPIAYGIAPGQIRGATLINSVALPYSQAMLRTPGLITNIVRKNLKDVVGSLWSGEGLLFRGEQAFDTFLAEGDPRGLSERRLTSNTYPAEAMYFVQTLTTGTSPRLDPALVRGMPISLVTSHDDQLMGAYAQKMTYDHIAKSDADVIWEVIPGRHFSPIVTIVDEPVDRVLEIMMANTAAFEHAFQGL